MQPKRSRYSNRLITQKEKREGEKSSRHQPVSPKSIWEWSIFFFPDGFYIFFRGKAWKILISCLMSQTGSWNGKKFLKLEYLIWVFITVRVNSAKSAKGVLRNWKLNRWIGKSEADDGTKGPTDRQDQMGEREEEPTRLLIVEMKFTQQLRLPSILKLQALHKCLFFFFFLFFLFKKYFFP